MRRGIGPPATVVRARPPQPKAMSSGRTQHLLFALLLAASPTVAAAQDAPAAHRTWMTYTLEQPLPRRFGLVLEGQGRFDGATFDHAQQLLLRAGLDYSPAPGLRLAAGWHYVRTESDAGDGTVPEQRIWEQAQLTRALGRFALSNRVRLEQRWIGADASADSAGPTGAPKWARANRLRYQLRGTVPIGSCLPSLRCYLAASDELFVGLAAHGGRALSPDQNRAALAVGSRVLPALRVELGYLNQAGIAADGTLHVRVHALTLGVTAGAAR